MTLFLTQKGLEEWLTGLIKEVRVVAPVNSQGLILYQPIQAVEEIAFGYQNTAISPKEFFFPRSEVLFTLSRNGREPRLPVVEESVFFGYRPCDAMALAHIDKPYLAPPHDALYAQHRDKTTLVGLACQKPGPQCFCTSMSGGPQDATHLDLLLLPVEEGYLLKVVTDKGQKLVARAATTKREVQLPPPPELPRLPTKDLPEAVKRSFQTEYWDRVADRCIHCHECAFVCPACYCFDVRDYPTMEEIRRIRSWDSCQSPTFTRIAGGYNRRATKGMRLRQRFSHHLLYFPEEFGSFLCVGCGRCVTVCPVNIDIREIIQDLQKREVVR